MNNTYSFHDLREFKLWYGIHKWQTPCEKFYDFVNRIALNNTFPAAADKVVVVERLPEHLSTKIKAVTQTRLGYDEFDLILIYGYFHIFVC